MTSLVKDLRALSVIDYGDGEKEIDLSEVMTAVIDGNRAKFEEHRIQLEMEIEDGITVKGDEERIRKAIKELVNNSLMFAKTEAAFKLERDNERIKLAVNTTAVLSLISGIILLFIGLTVSKPVLKLMGTPDNIIHDAVHYLRIYFLGIPFFMVYNFGASILRSKGDTKRPLYILIIAGFINVILNLIFVIVFHMGVAGVAIATDIANMYCAIRITWILLQPKTNMERLSGFVKSMKFTS